MNRQREYSDLKRRAMLAKKRMKMGYWQQLQQERVEMLVELGEDKSSQQKISEVQRARLVRDNNKSVNNQIMLKEEELYQKVKEMLDENECSLNPIGQLIDKNIYGELDERNKQKYILSLQNKYQELRDRYYKEKSSKIK